MASLRLFSISFVMVMVTAACGAGARYQAIGRGRTVVAGAPAAVGPGADATAGMTAAVALPADRTDSTYKVDLSVWLPRAMVVDWTVRCGTATAAGVVGETFDDYRTRRLEELRSIQVHRQQAASAVGSLVGGAVLGQNQASAAVETPAAQGQATVAVDGAAAGGAAGAALVSTEVQLPNGDLGQGFRKGSATVRVAEANAGTCAVELAPREAVDAQALAYLTGTFDVARLDDTARWQAVRAREEALTVRADLRAHLIAGGGDVDLRWKRAEQARLARDADAAERARAAQAAAAEHARVAQAAIDHGLQISIAIDGRARALRQSIFAYLTLHGADPGLRARLAAEEDARLAAGYAERDRRLAIRVAAEERREQAASAERDRLRAIRLAEEQRRDRADYLRYQLAIDLRVRVRGVLMGRGADPGLRARLAAQARGERERRDAELRAERLRRDAVANAQAAADLEAWRRGQDDADRRIRMALGLRASLTAQLTGRGARVRSPMPAPVDEMPGEPPLPGYTWVSGEWQWISGDWRWMPGSWLGSDAGGQVVTTTTTTTATVGATVELPPPPPPVTVDAGVTVGGVTVTVGAGATVPAPRPRPPARPRSQDHR